MHALGDSQEHLGVVIGDSESVGMDECLAAGLVVLDLESEGLRRGGLRAFWRFNAHLQRDMLFKIRLVDRMGKSNGGDDLVNLRVNRVLVERRRADGCCEGGRAEMKGIVLEQHLRSEQLPIERDAVLAPNFPM